MRRHVYIEPPEDEGEFGPGTDVILGFLALVLIILALSFMVPRAVLQANAPPEPAAGDPAVVREAQARATAAEQTAARLTEELRQVADQARRADEEVARLQNLLESSRIDSKAPPPAVSLRTEGEGASLFTKGSSTLTDVGKSLLVSSLDTLRGTVIETGANHLEILGYSSPEPLPGKGDRNLDLSVDRAVAVAHHMAVMGIPYECMSVVGMGRSRSHVVFDSFKNLSEPMAKWDTFYMRAVEQRIPELPEIERQIRGERRVDISAVGDSESKCTHQRLRAALERIRAQLGKE